jgi:hypothetical protein
MMIDTKKRSFDMQEIANRRFMYSPDSGALILGYQYRDSKKVISGHAEEHSLSDTDEPYDCFIRGWVGAGGSYPDGVIHFTPPVPENNPGLINKGYSALEMFGENGARAGTVVRAMPGAWEQPFSHLIEAAPKENWLHGIKPMTRDGEGFIYYKDKEVEHYRGDYVYSSAAKRDLTELRNRCDYLERNGIEISCANVIWGWENHKDAYGREKKEELDRILDGGGITFSKVVIDNNRNREIEFYRPGAPYWDELKNGSEFMDLYNNCDRELGFEVSVQSYLYGKAAETESKEAIVLMPSCFDYLQENGLLEKVKSQNFMTYPEREREYETESEAYMDNESDDEEMEDEL